MGKDVHPLQSAKLVYQLCSRSWAARTLTWVIYGTKHNLSYALHWSVIINWDLLFFWVGIYLYLVTDNKTLTNLFPTTCWAMNVCELTIAVLTSPRSRTGTTRWGAWRMSQWDSWKVYVVVTPFFEGKPNANHVRASIRNSCTQRLHKWLIGAQCFE
jgi:hypothetical protein